MSCYIYSVYSIILAIQSGPDTWTPASNTCPELDKYTKKKYGQLPLIISPSFLSYLSLTSDGDHVEALKP